MGISKLLEALKTITRKSHLSKYANLRVAIDSYCWLHKAVYTCAQDLACGRDTGEYVKYCLNKVELLQKHNITVVMVFDGGKLPSKQGTEQERENQRQDCLRQAKQLQQNGNRDKALQKYAGSIDITPLMAQKLLLALKEKSIECIVAPFEADAQLAYLSITKYVDVVVTEDSDLLAYGAHRVFFKMDKNGNGEEINLLELEQCTEYNFQNWSHNQFLTMCILSGCDYLDSINGVGIKTAYQAVQGSANYKQAIDFFQRKQKFRVPYDYIERFERAFLTFRFQRVFCPQKQRLVTLHDMQMDENALTKIVYPMMIPLIKVCENLDFIGAYQLSQY